MSTFWHKMSDLAPVCSIFVEIDRKIIFLCPLRYIFVRLVCILKLEGLLQGYVKWKNTKDVTFFSVNFHILIEQTGFKNHIFVPSPLH